MISQGIFNHFGQGKPGKGREFFPTDSVDTLYTYKHILGNSAQLYDSNSHYHRLFEYIYTP